MIELLLFILGLVFGFMAGYLAMCITVCEASWTEIYKLRSEYKRDVSKYREWEREQ